MEFLKKLSKVDAEIDKRSSRFEEVKDEQKQNKKKKMLIQV